MNGKVKVSFAFFYLCIFVLGVLLYNQEKISDYLARDAVLIEVDEHTLYEDGLSGKTICIKNGEHEEGLSYIYFYKNNNEQNQIEIKEEELEFKYVKNKKCNNSNNLSFNDVTN